MTNAQVRYYLHGDRKEDDLNLFFCSRCDAFVPQDHFSEPCHPRQRDTNDSRYRAECNTLPTYMKNTEGRKRRPMNPLNCFA